MGGEYDAKVFKSGNSVALRLPKALGLKEGDVMRLREEERGLVMTPLPAPDVRIDLSGIYGAVPGIRRPSCDENPRDWDPAARHA